MLKRKLKREAVAVAVDSHQSQVDEEIGKHQSLLQDYFLLQKESVSMKKKLQKIKQEREILMAEVEFLRQRYGYLIESSHSIHQTDQDHPVVPPQNSAMENKDIGKPPKPMKKKHKNGLINAKGL